MPEEQIAHMTLAGWVFLVAFWLVITSLTVFCIIKILSSGKKIGPDETPLE